MARWNTVNVSLTPVAVADTTAFTDSGYTALQGGSTTQRINILECMLTGQGTASSAGIILLARDSTVAITAITAGTNGRAVAALDPASAALGAPPLTVGASTTKPQRSSTLVLANLSFNQFGGIVRWVAAPGEELGLLGNTASFGEASISAYTGSGVQPFGTTIVFEPF